MYAVLVKSFTSTNGLANHADKALGATLGAGAVTPAAF